MVTRPAHQAGPLVEMIEGRGGRVISFPVLAIADVPDPAPVLDLIDRLDHYDLAIFVSANAVERGIAMVTARRGGWPAGVALAAVGAGTGTALERHGIGVTFSPDSRYDSEGLLSSPALQAVNGRRVLIFRGQGGRELLADGLRGRGAHVDYAEVYRRVRPPGRWEAAIEGGAPHAVVVTSGEGLTNLYHMTGEVQRPLLLATPLVVISERIAAQARQLGFAKPPVVASQAADSAVTAAIAQWWAANKCMPSRQ